MSSSPRIAFVMRSLSGERYLGEEIIGLEDSGEDGERTREREGGRKELTATEGVVSNFDPITGGHHQRRAIADA